MCQQIHVVLSFHQSSWSSNKSIIVWASAFENLFHWIWPCLVKSSPSGPRVWAWLELRNHPQVLLSSLTCWGGTWCGWVVGSNLLRKKLVQKVEAKRWAEYIACSTERGCRNCKRFLHLALVLSQFATFFCAGPAADRIRSCCFFLSLSFSFWKVVWRAPELPDET